MIKQLWMNFTTWLRGSDTNRQGAFIALCLMGLLMGFLFVGNCAAPASPKTPAKSPPAFAPASKEAPPPAGKDTPKEEKKPKTKPFKRVVTDRWAGIPEGFEFPEGVKLGGKVPTDVVRGVDRVTMTEKQLNIREYMKVMQMVFVVMSKPEMIEGAPKMEQYRDLIKSSLEAMAKEEKEAGKKVTIPVTDEAVDAILGQFWLESQGNNDAKPGTSSAAGIPQITKPTGRGMGLKVGDCRDLYKDVQKKVKGKKKLQTVKVFDKTVCDPDERLIPEIAIPAAVRLIGTMKRKYRSGKFATQGYHMGEKVLDELIKIYLSPNYDESVSIGENISRAKITYSDIYFRNTPYYNAGTYLLIEKHNTKEWDYSPNYYFRVRAAIELLKLYKIDEKKFMQLAKAMKKSNGEKATNAYWAWYPQIEDGFEILKDEVEEEKEIAKGNLIFVENDPELYGFELLLDYEGSNPIAEFTDEAIALTRCKEKIKAYEKAVKQKKTKKPDPCSKEEYDKLLKAAQEKQKLFRYLGLQAYTTLYDYGQEYLKLTAKAKDKRKPAVSSMGRPWSYQLTLIELGFPATKDLPAHCSPKSLAFDLWKTGPDGNPLSEEMERNIEFLNSEFASTNGPNVTPNERGNWHFTVPPL